VHARIALVNEQSVTVTSDHPVRATGGLRHIICWTKAGPVLHN